MYTRPSFPFYPDRFMGGTKMMSAAAKGCFMSMLCVSWNHGPIPNNKAAIIRAMELSPLDPPFDEIWAEVGPKWTATPQGLQNRPLEQIRLECEATSKSNSTKALAGVAKRKNKDAGAGTLPLIQPEPQPEPQPQSQPDASRTPAELSAAGIAAVPAETQPSLSVSSSRSSSTALSHTEPARPTDSVKARHPRSRHAESIVQSPKAHAGHAWCDGRVKCVPAFVHPEAVIAQGGDVDTREARAVAWYGRIAAEMDGQQQGEDAPKFWRRMVARDFSAPIAAPRPTVVADGTLDALLDRIAVDTYQRTCWFKGAELRDGVILVDRESAVEWIERHYLEPLAEAHGAALRVELREGVPA